jgi:ureidoacrylate peracid hydrolase
MESKTQFDRTALIVVDMQNAYLHPQGSFAKLWPHLQNPSNGATLDLARLRRAIPGCIRLVSEARRANIPVIYLTYVYRPDYKDGGVLIEEINPALRTVGYVADGTWDAEIIEKLKPRSEDFIVKKARYSGFHATQLDTVLSSLRASDLVICGVTTHFCVECTARDAHMRDFRVVIASDATDEVNETWKETSLASFAVGFGWVKTVDEIVAAWQGTATTSRTQP